VGIEGTGTLDILDGASVDVGQFITALYPGSRGDVTVSGAGSAIQAYRYFVADAGAGTLLVEDGGVVAAVDGIGMTSIGTASMTVRGAGSRVETAYISAALFGGTASIAIEDGGLLATSEEVLLAHAGSSYPRSPVATAVVRGANSLWDCGGDLVLGGTGYSPALPGSAHVSVEDGGELRGGGRITIWEGSSLTARTGASVSSRGLHAGTTEGPGANTLLIESGATLVNDGDALLAANAGATTDATVTGAGSTWTNTGGLYVGGTDAAAGGTATVTVADSGALDIGGEMIVWDTSTLTVTSGQMDVDGPVRINGTADLSGGTTAAGHLYVGDATAGVGGALTISATASLDVGGALRVERGQMDMTGGEVSVGDEFFADAPVTVSSGLLTTTDGHITDAVTASGGRVEVADLWTIGSPGNLGTLTVRGTAEFVADTIAVAHGELRLEDGLLDAGALDVTPGTGTLVMTGGTLRVGTLNAENFQQDGGTLQIGSSPGSSTIQGNYTMGAGVTLPMELGGTIEGGEYDHLTVTGTMTQGGTLDVVYWDGFTPSRGDRFNLFDWGARAGSFATRNLPNPGAGLAWDMDAFDTAGTLAVVSTTQDRLWDGANGVWTTATDWTENAVPTALQDAHINNGGTVVIATGMAAICQSLAVGQHEGHTGQLDVTGGSLTIGQDLIVGTAGVGSVAISDGAVTAGQVGVGAGSSLSLAGGSLTAQALFVSEGSTFDFTGGHLFLMECYGDLANAGGTLHPGASPGILEVFGDYVQLADAWLEIELSGLDRGLEYDALDATGELFLDGGLRVLLTDGFMPTVGQSFHILSWNGALTGEFATLDLPALADPDLYWSTAALYTDGILGLGAVPEPCTVGLLALGILALARRRRRGQPQP
ncbi:PEP-CTERM sorting domain-containing protein, partial [bacterium]|nr:PEP-CTERM sorting domain-containing protein [bacterium]